MRLPNFVIKGKLIVTSTRVNTIIEKLIPFTHPDKTVENIKEEVVFKSPAVTVDDPDTKKITTLQIREENSYSVSGNMISVTFKQKVYYKKPVVEIEHTLILKDFEIVDCPISVHEEQLMTQEELNPTVNG